jgi:serine/threonine-protein kinase
LERLTLLEQIGRGGMGVVWKAHDEQTGQTVAVKLLNAAYADQPEYVARFERELELARRIHSKNVVEVLGYGVRDGTPYLALQYVDGPSIRQRLADNGTYSWDDARALLVQVTQGLVDAHAAGVVHRDVKPSNILVGTDGVARLADFGIAKGIDLTRVTGTSALLGTPAYLPPEGAKDERSDLYSLGVVAFELLVGVPPFEGDTFSDVMLAHMRTLPDLSRLPIAARPIVGWLLAKDPNARPQTAAQLLKVLEGKAGVPAVASATESTSVAAVAGAEMATRLFLRDTQPPDGRPARVRRRRRVLAGLLVGALVVVLAAGAVLGATGTFATGSRPTASNLMAAGGVRQLGDPTNSLAPTAPTGLTVTITPLANASGSGETTSGAASPTPSATVIPTPSLAAVTPPPVTAPPVTPPPVTPPPVTARPVTPPPVTPPPVTPRPVTAPPLQPPNAPSNLSVSAVAGSAIQLTWNDNSTNETGFELDNGTSDLGSVPANTTTWTMTGLAYGQYMCFHLYAFNAAGHSAWTTPYACTTTLSALTTGSQAQADYNAGQPGVYCKNPAKTTNWIHATADVANFADYGMADDGLVCAVLGNFQATPYDNENWSGYQNAYWEPRHPDFEARGTNVSSIRVQYQGS